MKIVYPITNSHRLFYFLGSKVWLYIFEFVCSVHRSNHWRCFVKKGVLRDFAKFTGKHLCQRLFFNKIAAILFKKSLWHRCFPVNFAKYLRTPFSQNTSEQLLLCTVQCTLHNGLRKIISLCRVILKGLGS